MAKRFSIEAIFKGVDLITRPIRRMSSSVRKFTRGAERGLRTVGRRVDTINRGLMAVGRTALLTGGILAGILTNAVLTGADFEQTLVDAAVKFPTMIRKGTKEFDALEQAALNTAASSRFMAQETAGALFFMAKAGFDATAATNSLGHAVDFATANNAELVRATDIVTDAMAQFGLTSKNAEERVRNFARVTDVFTIATNRANTDMEQFFETLTDAGPLAIAAGQTVEDTAGAIAALADVAGLKGSKAGTALKNIMLGMSAPTSEAGKAMKLLKVNVADAAGNFRPLSDVMADMSVALGTLTQEKRLKVIDAIFGRRGISGAINLMKDQGRTIRKIAEEIEGASGATQKWADVQRDTTKGAIDEMRSSIEATKIEIFKAVQGPITDAIKKTTEWFRANKKLIGLKVGEWIHWIANNFRDIVIWTKRIGATLAIWFLLVTVLKTLILVVTALNIVMAMNPVVLITAAVVLLIAALVLMVRHWDTVRLAFKHAPTWMRVLFAPLSYMIELVDTLQAKWDQFLQALPNAIAKVSSAIDTAGIITNYVASKVGVSPVAVGLAAGASVATAPAGGGVTNTNTTRNEVVIRDETGRASATAPLPSGVTVVQTGGF